ncbi:MAG: hypothetical protein ACREDR_39740 [Blastocatellia bacterium]
MGGTMETGEQWRQRHQQFEAATRRERGRTILWHSALAAQSVERAGIEGIAVLLVLFTCTGGVALVAYLLYRLVRASLGVLRVTWFLLRLGAAGLAGSSKHSSVRYRGRREIERLAVRLRDRSRGVLHRSGRIAKLTCSTGGRVSVAARIHLDFNSSEEKVWLAKLRKTVDVPVSNAERFDVADEPLPVVETSACPASPKAPTAPPWEPGVEPITDRAPAEIDDLLEQDVAFFDQRP